MTTPTTGTAAKKTASASRPTTPVAKAAGETSTPTMAKSLAGSLQKHLEVMAEADLRTPQGLFEFLEASRAVSQAMSFLVEAGSTQLELAVKRGARDAADGRLTLSQKMELRQTLRRVSREMGHVKEDLLTAAKGAVQAYAPMENFLETLEHSETKRPHRGRRGGFDPFGGG